MKLYLVNDDQRAQFIEESIDGGQAKTGSFRQTNGEYTESDLSGSKTGLVCVIDTDTDNFESFKSNFLKEFGDYPSTKQNAFRSADYINTVRYLLNPAQNHFTLPVSGEHQLADVLFSIFGKEKSDKYENTDLFKLDLNFTDGNLSDDEKQQLAKFKFFIEHKFSTVDASTIGPDLMTLYSFASLPENAVEVIADAPEAPAISTPDAIQDTGSNNNSTLSAIKWQSIFSGEEGSVSTIPSAFFDNYAVATHFDLKLKGDHASFDIYRDVIIDQGSINLTNMQAIQNQLQQGSGIVASLTGLNYSSNFKDASAINMAAHAIEDAIAYFSAGTAVADFTFKSVENGEFKVKAFVDSEEHWGLIYLEVTGSDGSVTRYGRDTNDVEFNYVGENFAGLSADELSMIHAHIASSIKSGAVPQIRADLFETSYKNQ